MPMQRLPEAAASQRGTAHAWYRPALPPRSLPCADVAGHEHQRVAEIQGPVASSQGQSSAIQHIKQAAHDFRTGLLQLVEQHDTGPAEASGDGLGVEQGRAFLAAHVAGRGSGDRGGVVFLGQGIHVDAAEGVRLAMNGLGQQTDDLGLANPGRAEEEIDRQRTFGIADSGLDHAKHRLDFAQHRILTNDTTAQQRHDGLGVEQEARRRLRRVVLPVAGLRELGTVVLDQFIHEWHERPGAKY